MIPPKCGLVTVVLTEESIHLMGLKAPVGVGDLGGVGVDVVEDAGEGVPE